MMSCSNKYFFWSIILFGLASSDPLAPHKDSENRSLTWAVLKDAVYWLLLLCPELTTWRGGRTRSTHFYNSIHLIKCCLSLSLHEHLLLSLHESIEQRVNLRGVVFSQIKTFALWWQTDLFQAFLKHSTDRPAVRWVCSVSAWTSAVS